MSCEACDEREKKIDELLRTVKALKVDISGRSEITLLLQQKYEAEFHLRREVGGQLAIAVLQNGEFRRALDYISSCDESGICECAEHAKKIMTQYPDVAVKPKCECGCYPGAWCPLHSQSPDVAEKRIEPSPNDPNRCFCAGTWHCRWCGEEPCKCDPKRISSAGRVVE